MQPWFLAVPVTKVSDSYVTKVSDSYVCMYIPSFAAYFSSLGVPLSALFCDSVAPHQGAIPTHHRPLTQPMRSGRAVLRSTAVVTHLFANIPNLVRDTHVTLTCNDKRNLRRCHNRWNQFFSFGEGPLEGHLLSTVPSHLTMADDLAGGELCLEVMTFWCKTF